MFNDEWLAYKIIVHALKTHARMHNMGHQGGPSKPSVSTICVFSKIKVIRLH